MQENWVMKVLLQLELLACQHWQSNLCQRNKAAHLVFLAALASLAPARGDMDLDLMASPPDSLALGLLKATSLSASVPDKTNARSLLGL